MGKKGTHITIFAFPHPRDFYFWEKTCLQNSLNNIAFGSRLETPTREGAVTKL